MGRPSLIKFYISEMFSIWMESLYCKI